MPNTYSQLYIQIVFAVKGRQNFITNNIREETQKYISGIITANKQKLYAIYCMPDHTHILISMQPDVSASDLVRDIKTNSSSWIKTKSSSLSSFEWQKGFGAFSYSKSQSQQVVNYILNQPVHHRKRTFREEYIGFLKAYQIEFDNRYLFEFYD
jgi:REP element-mobilizing transposase RayT